MFYFVDTNIFIRVLIGDNKRQYTECLMFLKALKENKISAVTNTVVLSEIAWTLTSYYKIPKIQVIKSLRGLLQVRGLKIIDNYDHMLALDIYEKYVMKYIDALIMSNEAFFKKELVIVSYDRDFDKLKLVRKEPKEILDSLNLTN